MYIIELTTQCRLLYYRRSNNAWTAKPIEASQFKNINDALLICNKCSKHSSLKFRVIPYHEVKFW